MSPEDEEDGSCTRDLLVVGAGSSHAGDPSEAVPADCPAYSMSRAQGTAGLMSG